MEIGLIVVAALIVLIVIAIVLSYNGLTRLSQQADEAWSDITVQLKRRYDLIPNLVESVKGYAAHEKQVFEDVTNARSKALSANSVADTARAENTFQNSLKSLFAVAENYPDLKASTNFMQLQAELTDTEDKIQASRRFYNGVVRDFNIRRRTLPTRLIAARAGYSKDKEYFELDEAQTAQVAEPVAVSFN